MKFEVINKDNAVIRCKPLRCKTGIIFISVGGGMGVLCGILLAILPYVQPIFRNFIPFNFILSAIFIIIAAISIYIGYKYLKLTSLLAIDRKEGKIIKSESPVIGSVEKKEVYKWENIKSVNAERYIYGGLESPPWGGIIYFKLKNRKKVEALAGKGEPPEKIVEALLKFMKNPDGSEDDETYQPGFIIEE